MAFLKRNTAAALERAQEDLAATETAKADLLAEYDAKKLDGDPSELGRIQRGIEDQDRLLRLYGERIAGLQPMLEQELAEQKRRQREQAIAKAEQVLPLRMKAIFELCRWAQSGVALVAALEAASKLKDWPPDLERPYYDDVRNDRLLGAIARAFSGLGADWNPDRAIQIIGDAAEIEKEHHQSAIDDLRLNPVTGTAVESEAA
jgi:hypothetical protein